MNPKEFNEYVLSYYFKKKQEAVQRIVDQVKSEDAMEEMVEYSEYAEALELINRIKSQL
jgi:hypothetical protein